MEPLSPDEFQALVAEVMTTLPAEFGPYLTNLVVDCEEEPDEETLKSAGLTTEEIDQGDTLFGLYEPGIDGGVTSDSILSPGDLPSRIRIFRAPLMDEFPEICQLVVEIRKTVIHELAHHLGYNERDLARFDDKADPFAGRNMPWTTQQGDCT